MTLPRLLLYLVCSSVFAALIGGYFGALHPAFDSLAHFRLHFAVLAAVLGAALALKGGFLGGASMAVSGLLVLTTTLGPVELSPSSAGAPGGEQPVYRLLQVNLRYNNQTPKEVIRLISRLRPDVITAEEFSDMWRPHLSSIRPLYPYFFDCQGDDETGGVAIFSRRPFDDSTPAYCSPDGALGLRAVNFGGRAVQIGAMHLYWPWPHRQARQISKMEPQFKSIALSGMPALLAGDANSAPWSHAVRRIEKMSETTALRYRGGSWIHRLLPPAWAGWLGIPIDNVFAAGINVRAIATQAADGSDHLPVLVEFSLRDTVSAGAQAALAN